MNRSAFSTRLMMASRAVCIRARLLAVPQAARQEIGFSRPSGTRRFSGLKRLPEKFRIGVIFGTQNLKGVALISWLLRNGHDR